jgi:rod shape determining protein RodA
MRRGSSILFNIDWVTIIIYLVMVTMGWLNIFSAVYAEDHPNILDMNQRYGKQFLWIGAAILLTVAILLIDYRFYDYFAYVFYGLALLILIMVLVAGKEINGSKSWIIIGGFQIQPSEFAKPAAALALAKFLSAFNVNVQNFRTFLKAMALVLLPAAIIMLQPDTGSAIVFFALILPIYREGFSPLILLIIFSLIIMFFMVLLLDAALVLLILAGIALAWWWFKSGSFKSFAKAVLIFAGVFIFFFGVSESDLYPISTFHITLISIVISATIMLAIIISNRIRKAAIIIVMLGAALMYTVAVNYAFHNVLSNYQQKRIGVMLGFEQDLHGAGYNVNQSKIAIGSGGFSGKGYLNGTQTKLHFVPEQSTDFIFCTVGEEWGFVGSFVVIALFVALLVRLIQLAERQRSTFARIYGYGVFSIIFFHFVINIAMTIGLFPVIGIPLPFFSYGGSSLWAFTILLFVFLRMDSERMELNH